MVGEDNKKISMWRKMWDHICSWFIMLSNYAQARRWIKGGLEIGKRWIGLWKSM